jgi:membrane-associated phospholipid phosphatase
VRKLDLEPPKRSIVTPRRLRRLLWIHLFSITATVAAPSRAGDAELSRVSPVTLGLELVGATALYGSSLLLPAPTSCRWCDPPFFDEALAGELPAANRRTASSLSDALSSAVIPAAGVSMLLIPPLTSTAPTRHALENISIGLEAGLLSMTLTQLTKKIVARKRPAFYYERGADSEYGASPKEGNVSFFSGHTSTAFAIVGAVATISFQRGYRSAPYVAAVGCGLALSSALLRIAADVHWPSDVLTGALVGTGVGVLVPLLLHPRASEGASGSSATFTLRPLFGSESALLLLAGEF